MTSAEIRQSFLDFFKSKGHTLVPSASLMPDSPNLLFTNAGMNQFVPIFLGQRAADVSKWAGAVPGSDTRAADTQKCIRAGGKHNDLEDVGLDTYHHTFFEMLGNWSFGDYFKQEAIDWAWELITEVWKFPKNRLYATVYSPDKAKGDPADFDQEAYDIWAAKFRAAGLDPSVHIVNGGKKDNFWMMGDTGPCGPCSEIHVDLTPQGDTKGRLVNQGTAECIEIWNLVFIQFNANPDGTFSALPARHVDTGMGFERVTGIIQNTRNFTDFSRTISNYETDVFRPIFDKIEQLSGKKYHSTLPASGASVTSEQQKVDIAFRVIADHIRTLSFAIADGIQPGNTDRNYVLRRILRRAVRYGRTLGFHEPFFYKLVSVLADGMGQVFPEVRAKQDHIEQVIQREEEAFNKTLDRGIEIFGEYLAGLRQDREKAAAEGLKAASVMPGRFAFTLYDTYGFPLDLTQLMARENGVEVAVNEFDALMEEQKARARAAQKKQVIELSQVETTTPTRFVGFEKLETPGEILEVVGIKDKTAVILDTSPFYAEMGGQVGDTGEMTGGGELWTVANTQKAGDAWLHFLADKDAPAAGTQVQLSVDRPRREAIQRHHTVTHLLHWALHEVVSPDATQKGSYVGPDKLTFDFSSAPLTPQQVADVERLVNERILENASLTWTEAKYKDVKSRKDIMQFFGEKYGDVVRVVQIGGKAASLDGYSMELCGGTHTRATGEIGLFRIAAESAIAAGIRRIEAVSGLEAYKRANEELQLIKTLSGKVNSPIGELEKKIESLLAQQKELEKQLKAMQQKQAADIARGLATKAEMIGGTPVIVENLGAADGDFLQSIADGLKGQFKGVVVLGGTSGGAVALVATVAPELTKKIQAGKIIQTIAPIVGGKGGGRPDNARGGGKDVSKLGEALAKAKSLLG
jgi:alanyl-tRNA synthetase